MLVGGGSRVRRSQAVSRHAGEQVVGGELAIWPGEAKCEWEKPGVFHRSMRVAVGQEKMAGCQQSVPAQCNTFARNGTTFGPRTLRGEARNSN